MICNSLFGKSQTQCQSTLLFPFSHFFLVDDLTVSKAIQRMHEGYEMVAPHVLHALQIIQTLIIWAYAMGVRNKTKQFWYLSFSRCHFTGSYNFDGKPGYLPLVLIIDCFRSSWNQTQETVVILKETQSGVSAKSSTWPPSPFCKSSNTPCLGRKLTDFDQVWTSTRSKFNSKRLPFFNRTP